MNTVKIIVAGECGTGESTIARLIENIFVDSGFKNVIVEDCDEYTGGFSRKLDSLKDNTEIMIEIKQVGRESITT